jgi:hypothetical protein
LKDQGISEVEAHKGQQDLQVMMAPSVLNWEESFTLYVILVLWLQVLVSEESSPNIG